MRKKKHLNDRMALVSSFLIGEPSDMAGKWAHTSGGRPLHLEIGCGKGKFICETAASNPGIFFIALEKIRTYL
jgi:tRNA (guanine-N7-)-methyltransferase